MEPTATSESEPASVPADCAWCRRDFASIVELLDHVDATHLPPPVCAA
jgi:hypothetical protein